MAVSIQDIYRSYLWQEASLDDLRDWLALNQWSLSEADKDLADEADVALVHLDDGYIDEGILRRRLRDVIEEHTVPTVSVVVKTGHLRPAFRHSYQYSSTAATTPREVVLAISAAV